VLDTAGQGMFYHGRVADFGFVFDCGSSSRSSSFENAISRFKSGLGNHSLDLLVISHLHADHVSGLDELLRGIRVRYAVVPYLDPLERLFVALRNRRREDWYHRFLADPVSFLFERDVEKIVVIGSGNDKQRHDDRGSLPPETGEEGFARQTKIDDDSFDMPNDETTEEDISHNESDWRRFLGQGRLLVKNHRGCVKISNVWLFRFFNYRVEKSKLTNFGSCVRKEFGIQDHDVTAATLGDILIDGKRRRKLAQCYKMVDRDLNNTSLIAFHGPLFRIRIRPSSRYGLRGLVFPPGAWNIPEGYVGYFLTGDTDLNHPMWTDCESHFHNYFGRISGVLLPHHGAKKNWNRKLVDSIISRGSYPNWYVSAGIGNRYGHPSAEVIQDVLGFGHGLAWSNEFLEVLEEYPLR